MDPRNPSIYSALLAIVIYYDMLEPERPSCNILQDTPGLLLTNCLVHSQWVYVHLDPLVPYKKHVFNLVLSKQEINYAAQ